MDQEPLISDTKQENFSEMKDIFGDDEESEDEKINQKVSSTLESNDNDIFGDDDESEDDHVNRKISTTKSKNTDLFGDDDESENEQINVNRKISNTKNNDLFGDDDDEDEDDADEDDLVIESKDDFIDDEYDKPERQNSDTSLNNKKSSNELDQIFGEKDEDIIIDRSKINLKFKNISHISSNNLTYSIRIPNFIHIQSNEYNSKTHKREEDIKDLADNVTSVIRWRYKKDNNNNLILNNNNKPIKESNARLVKLSDGSLHVIIGDTILHSNIASTDNTYVYAQQKNINELTLNETNATKIDNNNNNNNSNNNKTSLECIGIVPNRINLQASTIKSNSHTLFANKISDKFRKNQGYVCKDAKLTRIETVTLTGTVTVTVIFMFSVMFNVMFIVIFTLNY